MKQALAVLILSALCGPLRAGWGDPYAKIAKELTADLGELADAKAAVVPFRYSDGRSSEGGAVVAAALETAIVKRNRLKLVERGQLDKLLAELKLQRTGIVPAEKALAVGKMSGADLLVTGTLTDLDGGRTELHAKLIRVETGEVLRAAQARVKKTWRDVPAAAPAGVPPAARLFRVTLSSAVRSGAARKIRGRDLAFRYADQGRRPVLRVTDYADPQRPKWTEVPIRYDPQTNTYREFSRDFRLAGRKYRLWVDLKSNLHVAPRSGLFGGIDESAEVVIGIQEVFRSWIADIETHHQELSRGDGRKSLAYIEPLGRTAVRISVFSAKMAGVGVETEPVDFILDYEPQDVQVLRAKRGGLAASRLMYDGVSYYRFYFDAGKQDIRVEKAQ